MKRKNEFNPDWCIAPGSYLKEVMQVRKISRKKVIKILWGNAGRGEERLDVLFSGEHTIGDYLASQLEALTTVPKHIWLNMEKEYRKGLKAGLKEIK